MPTTNQWDELRQVLIANYFRNDLAYLMTDRGRADVLDHLRLRSEKFTRLYLPWINSIQSLKGARVLEIGSGTGCSTVIFAQAGARVTALDMDEKALTCCRTRLNIHGLEADYVTGNAVDQIAAVGDQFDIICFWASLEHMTTVERLEMLRAAWQRVRKNGLVMVIECPNRLWYFDDHTSLLPFWMWLPDDLAIAYRKQQTGVGPPNAEALARSGRGVSYHEFELSGMPIGVHDQIASLQLYTRKRNPLKALKWRFTRGGRYSRLLGALHPGLHPAFRQPNLDVAIRKI